MESVKALFSNAPAGPALPSSGAPYRLVYFNCRGAVEHVRLLLALSGERWDDVRYPLGAAAAGFAPAERFRAERDAGAFAANMGALPVLVAMIFWRRRYQSRARAREEAKATQAAKATPTSTKKKKKNS